MSALPWQVVTHWLGPNSSEYTQTSAFPTYEDARNEIQRLTHHVGALVNGRLLKSVLIVGDYQSMWKQKV